MSRRNWIILIVVIAAAVVAIISAVMLTTAGVTVPDVTGKTQSDARAVLESAGLILGTVTEKADAQAEAGLIVGQQPEAGAEVDKGSAVALTVSSGPATASVPDVTGKDVTAAEEELAAAGFDAEATFQYDTEAPKDEVMAQLPQGGDQAYPGSTVGLLVSRGEPQRVKVPDVTGKSQEEATSTLADKGLHAVPTQAYDDQVPEGLVADQDPAAGETVVPLSDVLIVVSLGKGSSTVTVPDVIGLTQQAAEEQVSAAGLSAATAQAYTDAVKKGVVFGQEPAAGAEVKADAEVGLLVSLGSSPSPSPTPSESPSPTATPSASTSPSPSSAPSEAPSPSASPSTPPGGGIRPPGGAGVELVKVPDVVGRQIDEATAELTQLGLRSVPLKSPHETEQKGVVFAQLPAAGIRLPQTFPVLMLVSTGPVVQVNPLPASPSGSPSSAP